LIRGTFYEREKRRKTMEKKEGIYINDCSTTLIRPITNNLFIEDVINLKKKN
jgi:hypothetical protein